MKITPAWNKFCAVWKCVRDRKTWFTTRQVSSELGFRMHYTLRALQKLEKMDLIESTKFPADDGSTPYKFRVK